MTILVPQKCGKFLLNRYKILEGVLELVLIFYGQFQLLFLQCLAATPVDVGITCNRLGTNYC